jgi:hypothetical protein
LDSPFPTTKQVLQSTNLPFGIGEEEERWTMQLGGPVAENTAKYSKARLPM